MNLRYIDNSVNPKTDFFKFACGKWLEKHPQPDDKPSWDTFDVLNECVLHQLNDVINNIDTSDLMGRKMKDYLEVMTDTERRERERWEPLIPYLLKLQRLENKEAVLEFMIKDMGIEPFIYTGVGPDDKNSTHYEVQISQNLLLGNREYYLSKEKRNKDIVKKMKEVARNIFRLCDTSDDISSRIIDNVMHYETEIAKVAYDVEKEDRPEFCYHMMSVDEISEMVGGDFKCYLALFGFTETDKVIIHEPEVLKRVFELYNEMSLDTLKDIMCYNLLMDSISSFSFDFKEAEFEFKKFLTGAKEMTPRWKRIVNTMDGVFSEPLGKKYSEKYFDSDSKKKAVEILENIADAYAEIISEQTWMSDETKKIALEKLDVMKYKMGYPKVWKDYSDMPIDKEKSYFENNLAIAEYFHQRMLKERYNKDVDRYEWAMSPQTVNACAIPTMNEICFPAGILQPPFFSKDADDASNYGAIGVIIGHEITHHFDTCGRQYNKDGNYCEWWSDEDAKKFEELTKNTLNRFNSLDVLPFTKCNGKLTLDENIADGGGLMIAFRALKKVMENKEDEMIDGYDWKQRFFISYAQVWCGVDTEEIIRNSVMNNTHSVNYIRVNGTLPMINEWYDAFGCEKCDKLFVDSDKRNLVWR